MKKNLQSLLLLLMLSATAFAQDYPRVDNTVKTYPRSFASPQKLADRINSDFSSDTDKVRAAFTWIATNITYDLKAFKDGGSMVAFSYSSEADKLAKLQKYRADNASKTLRTHKGVCQDFSALFHTVSEAVGVKCLDIVGTSKAHPAHIGKLPKTPDHEWNAVKIGEHWRLIDVTWASGSVDMQTGRFVPLFNDAYFFTPPQLFFLNHFPEDRRLLMIDKTEQEFADLPLFYGPYIKSNYEIASPQNGRLSVGEGSVTFEILDFSGGGISYVLTSEGRVNSVRPSKSGNVTRFTVPLSGRSRGYLNLYVNNETVATYKLER